MSKEKLVPEVNQELCNAYARFVVSDEAFYDHWTVDRVGAVSFEAGYRAALAAREAEVSDLKHQNEILWSEVAVRDAEVVRLRAEVATLREGLSETVRAVLDIPDADPTA